MIFKKIYNEYYQNYKIDFFKIFFFLKKSKTNAPIMSGALQSYYLLSTIQHKKCLCRTNVLTALTKFISVTNKYLRRKKLFI
jgi:hypothetical protein